MDYLRKYQRNIVILIAASLILAAGLVFGISFRQMSETRMQDAEQIISLLCIQNAKEMNAHFDNVEQTVNTLHFYAMNNINKGGDLTKAENWNQLLENVRMMAVGAAENTDLVVSVFMRLDPNRYASDAGFYIAKDESGIFREKPITDLSKYDQDDYENVGWYYVPMDSGEPVWMSPYTDKTLKVALTTYVMPIIWDGDCIGVIGMDMELTKLTQLINDVKAYDTGYAYLTDMDDTPFYSGIDRKEDPEWMTYSQPLENGMVLCVTTPLREIRASSNMLFWKILSAVLISMFLATALSILLAIRMNKALRTTLGESQRAQREAYEEAKRANQAKSDFLSRMSHDIRTPINGIMGMIEILRHNRQDETRVDDCVNKIEISARHLLSLINDVLDMQKLESGKMVFSREAFQLRDIIGNCIIIAEPMASERNIKIFAEYEDVTHENLYGSILHIRQVFLNIISNAVKYNKQGGSVSVRVRETSDKDGWANFNIRVEDTGIGMSKEFMEQAFEPFTQEQVDGRTTYMGTGLGLAIVKKMVEGMGGCIRLESQKDVGTVFDIDLAFEINHNTIVEDKTEFTPADCKGMKILLVEDNDLNYEIADFLLQEAGILVSRAANGKEAVEAFAGHDAGTYDVILMDVMMPVLDGMEATRQIRAMDREDAREIPIIAMTANAFSEDEKNCREAGMNAHLAKPLDIQKVFEVLSDYAAPRKPAEKSSDGRE